eukprot:845351-Alexandrium_andersonii.AAC.1
MRLQSHGPPWRSCVAISAERPMSITSGRRRANCASRLGRSVRHAARCVWLGPAPAVARPTLRMPPR